MTEPQLRSQAAARWDFLHGVLPHGIDPTDIDLCYERNGFFLFLEGKRPGQFQNLKRGQRLFYERLHAPPRYIVVRFEGNPPDDVQCFGRWDKPLEAGDADGLRNEIKLWYEWANTQTAALNGRASADKPTRLTKESEM